MLSHSVTVVISIEADIQERLDCGSNEQQKLDHLMWVVKIRIESSGKVNTLTRCSPYSVSFAINPSLKSNPSPAPPFFQLLPLNSNRAVLNYHLYSGMHTL